MCGLLLVSCGDGPSATEQPAVGSSEELRRYDAAEVSDAVKFIEDLIGVEFNDVPTVWVGSKMAVAARVARLDDEPPAGNHVLRLPAARAASGLPVSPQARLLVDADGFFLADSNEVVLQLGDDGTAPPDITRYWCTS